MLLVMGAVREGKFVGTSSLAPLIRHVKEKVQKSSLELPGRCSNSDG